MEYLTQSMARPFAGAVGPAFFRSAEAMISDTDCGDHRPEPTRINVPAIVRTML